MFNNRDSDIILGIPLSSNVSIDTWSWEGERTGEFSVKSAYSMLQQQKRAEEMAANSDIWRQLWQLKVPPKVKNFLWRAVTARAGCYGGRYAVEVIEAMGIKEALSWVKTNNWQHVQIETDSLVSV
ncbi:uncharacterized protein LOC133034004 [Cannabis sativa]|uniref:uncharacterized protein LOC133034004 n=1 Tax=Cannabis sativa TaxID=3483 RepID=UPI0029CAAAE9|nr:uncharacterized protein LOC133034004 [Cannabis sativa]